MRLNITSRLVKKYPKAKFLAVLASGFTNEKEHKELEKEKAILQKNIQKYTHSPSNQKKIKDYNEFFSARSKNVPIEFQIQSVIDGKPIPKDTVLKDILFMTELKHECIISAYDLAETSEELQLDIASGTESFTQINKKEQDLKKDDIILKDKEEVLTSLEYGPGNKAKITKKTKDCLFLFWFFKDIDDEKEILKDLKAYLALVAGKKSDVKDITLTEISSEDFKVNPYEAKGNIDYDKVIRQFGVEKIDEKLLARIEKHAKKAGKELHHLLRRKKFFAHRDLKFVLDEFEKGNKFFLYTGRAPSGHCHLGHLVPWFLTKWLQDVFDVELYFQIPDEEKFLFKDNLTLEDTTGKFTTENILDVIALGFDPKKTHFVIDTQHAGVMYKEAVRIAKRITFSQIKSAFGFSNESNIGSIFYTAMQAVPAFLPCVLKKKKMPCLIPHAIDQDPHFRLSRDAIPKLGYFKPASIQCSFLPGLGGLEADGKMSASAANTAIYVVDDEKTVKKKINKYAFSGGRDTVEEHRKLGGNPDIDIAYQWLTFLEEDDKKLEKIYKDYKSGALLSGELKAILIEKINTFLKEHQKKREEARSKVDQFILKV